MQKAIVSKMLNKQSEKIKFLSVERLFQECLKGSPFAGKTFLVGGACRDFVLGEVSWDWDVVVEIDGGAERLCHFLADRFQGFLSRPHPIGKGYPIWQMVRTDTSESPFPEGFVLEVADSQTEMFPDSSTRARVTRFGSISEDCKRRDLTMNMLYRDFVQGEWVDPSGVALEDIQSKNIRGYPGIDLEKVFADDPLRILRLFRFQSYLEWKIEIRTLDAAKSQLHRLKILSFERIRDEWTKLFERGTFYKALQMYLDHGVLQELFPELLPMVGCQQDKIYHSEGDVWVHTLGVIKNCQPNRIHQLTGLLHDVGKPATQSFVGDRIKFIDHEKHSVLIAERFLEKLKIPLDERAKILKLIALHLRGGDVAKWTTVKPARKLLRDAGELIEDLILFIEADSSFSLRANGKPDLSHIPLLRQKIDEAKTIPVSLRPTVSGNELMEVLKRGPGPWIKQLQNLVRDWEDEYVSQNSQSPTRDEIWNFIRSVCHTVN